MSDGGSRFHDIFPAPAPVIGMIHLAPLPGSPGWGGSLETVIHTAVRDAGILAEEGVDGVLVENLGDAPFLPGPVPPETVAAMSVVVERLRSLVIGRVAWGVNVLRNDARGALAVAAASGASFIRVNVHLGIQATDQGWIEGRGYETMRLRASLAPRVAVLADACVKHARPPAPLPLTEEVADLVERGLVDAVLVTGSRTGSPPTDHDLREARTAARGIPVLAASGIDASSVAGVLSLCDGVIVGTALQQAGQTGASIDRRRVRRFLEAARSARAGGGGAGRS